MSPTRTRRNRIAWAVGTKLVLALTVTLATNLQRDAVEYRALTPLAGLRPGADVTLAGQLIGRVIALERRGDTTALRVRFNRGAERLPGSRTVQLRTMGLDLRVVLEVRIEARSARASLARPFALGGWLEVLPSYPAREVFGDLAGRLRPTLPPPPPPVLDLMPNALSTPIAAPMPRT